MKSRPAETGAAATALAVLLAHIFGVNDPSVIAALAVVVGFVPAVITWGVPTLRKRRTTPTVKP